MEVFWARTKALTTLRSFNHSGLISTQIFSSIVTFGSLLIVCAVKLSEDRVRAMIRCPASVLLLLIESERVFTTLRPVLPVAPTINIVGAIVFEIVFAVEAEVCDFADGPT